MGKTYTEAQKAASIKYLNEKTERIQIRVPKGKKEIYKEQAAAKGYSLNAYIVKLLEEDAEIL